METGVKVWIVNYAGHDFEAAKKYGELHHIVRGFISFQSLDRVKFQVIEKMREMEAQDYLLLSGTNVINVLAVTNAMCRFGKVNLLVFDKDENEYRELKLTTTHITELNDVYTG